MATTPFLPAGNPILSQICVERRNSMNIINLTKNDVTVIKNDGTTQVFPASGSVLRAAQTVEVVGNVDGIPLTKTVFTAPVLPDYKEDTFYIVSFMTAKSAYWRKDFLVPNQMVRQDGVIVGCRSLSFASSII